MWRFYGTSWLLEDDDELYMLLSRPLATVDSAERNSLPGSQCGVFTATSEFEDGLLLRCHTWRSGASVFRPGANVAFLPIKLS